jgi:hypothetical protein
MPGFFPTLEGDELFYSAVARYRLLLGNIAHRHLVGDVFGGWHKAIAVVDLPIHLDAFLERLPKPSPYSVEDIIDQHSLFPFYSAFARGDAVTRAREVMKSGGSGGAGWHLGLMRKPRPNLERRLSFCKVCADEDSAQFGMPIWRRTHQLPTALFCALHERPLHSLSHATLRTRGAAFLPFVTLNEELIERATPIKLPEKASKLIKRIDTSARWLLSNPSRGGRFSPTQLHGRLWSVLRITGWANGSLKRSALVAALENHLDPDTRNFLNIPVTNWSDPMLYHPRSTYPPIHWLALLDLLGVPVWDFLNDSLPQLEKVSPRLAATSSQGSDNDNRVIPAPESAPCRNRACSASMADPVSALNDLHLSVGPHVIRCSVCEFTYSWDPSRQRTWQILKSSREWDKWLASMIATTSLSAREIAGALGVTVMTMRHHASRLGVWRKSWKRRPAPADKLLRGEGNFG